MTVPTGLFDDKYEILHKIGEGGMGKVYKVRHVLLDDERVIKVIRQHPSDDGESLMRRFTEEARTATRLRHPGLAQLYDFSVAPDGTAVIVMEFIDGVTVLDLLRRRGPPPLGLTIEIALQALDALGYLHEEGYVHRDISPDNLMLMKGRGDRPCVKLIDLGLAKRLDSSVKLTATGAYLGKVRYSAPEQFGEEGADARSDVYSFGVMLYELLTGQLPITGEQFSEIVGGHLVRPPRDFAETDPDGRVPPELRTIVLRTLEKDPDRRLGSAMELRRLLEPFQRPYRSPFEDDDRIFDPTGLENAATVVTEKPRRPVSSSASSASPLTGRRSAIAVAVVVVVALAAWGAWWLARPGPGEEEFRLGVQALRQEDHGAAADFLRDAIESSPGERPELVTAVDEPYLPHFFLGKAQLGLNNYDQAWDAWQASLAQEAIQSWPGYLREIREGQERIAGLACDSAETKLRFAVDHAERLAPGHELLESFADARRQVAAACGARRDYADIRAALAAAVSVHERLRDFE